MGRMHYIELDEHKNTISFYSREAYGWIVEEGVILTNRTVMSDWIKSLPKCGTVGIETEMFKSWFYDQLTVSGITAKVAHQAMLDAIFAGKRIWRS